MEREAVEPARIEPALALPAPPAPVAMRRAQARRLAWQLLQDVSLLVVFFGFVATFVAWPLRVEGTSMQPLLRDGERILVNKLVYRFRPIEYGDVVVFRWPRDHSLSFIKRVVGKPGDLVEIRHGALYVNGRPVAEDYLSPQYRDDDDQAPHQVAPGCYYVLGDHRASSNDSRSWGDVPADDIYARAGWRFWPLSRWGAFH